MVIKLCMKRHFLMKDMWSCIPWDCCRQHIMKAIQQPLLNLICPSSLFCTQNYHPICPIVFLVPLSITPAPNQSWGITIRIIYKENAQPSDSNLFGSVLDLQLSTTNRAQRKPFAASSVSILNLVIKCIKCLQFFSSCICKTQWMNTNCSTDTQEYSLSSSSWPLRSPSGTCIWLVSSKMLPVDTGLMFQECAAFSWRDRCYRLHSHHVPFSPPSLLSPSLRWGSVSPLHNTNFCHLLFWLQQIASCHSIR